MYLLIKLIADRCYHMQVVDKVSDKVIKSLSIPFYEQHERREPIIENIRGKFMAQRIDFHIFVPTDITNILNEN